MRVELLFCGWVGAVGVPVRLALADVA